MQDSEIRTPSTVLQPHSVHQNGWMRTEPRQAELPAASGPGSRRDRARMDS